jgi:PAS domain S-box-containing protein
VAHRLLLVEDEAIIALNERSILERHGFSVDVRIDGIAAVEAATSADSPYDLILMDIDLGPGIDGIEAAARILDVLAVPIVFLTAHTEAETVARVEERTQYGYVLKNGREFTLVQSVKTALRLFAAHQEAAERDARFRRIFDSTPTIAIQGYRPDGTVIYWNDASEELCGYTAEEAIGASLLDLIIPESLHASVKAAVEETIRTGVPIPAGELELCGKDGAPVIVYSSHTTLQLPNGDTELFCLDLDISERRATEIALSRAESDYRMLVENQHDLIVRVDASGRFEFVSESYCRLFGRERDELLGSSFVPLVHQEDRAATEEAMQALFAPPWHCTLEQRAMTRDGWRWLEWDDTAVLDAQGNLTAIVGVGRDVTDRKEAAARARASEAEARTSEQRLARILDNLPIAVIISSGPSEEVLLVNRQFTETFGYTRDEVINARRWFELVYPDTTYREEIATRWSEAISHATEQGGNIGPVEADVRCRDGAIRRVSFRGHLLDELHMIILDDRTEAISTQRELEDLVAAKDHLMKELNHRVKNNLALVSSMVRLKADALGGIDLSDIGSQIDSIALIHETLMDSGDPSRIDFGPYAERLLEGTFSLHPRGPVTVENGILDLLVPSRTAVALGVILNELATNAMKHAFHDGMEARFVVRMAQSGVGDQCVLEVANSGRPLPASVSFDNPATLGLRLIAALVSQLHGTISVQHQPMTAFRIQFPCPE